MSKCDKETRDQICRAAAGMTEALPLLGGKMFCASFLMTVLVKRKEQRRSMEEVKPGERRGVTGKEKE